MSHADVLTALQAVCPPVKTRPETGVSLVARFKRDDLGLAELGTFVFTTDWHLVPRGTETEWPDGRVCTHPADRFSELVGSLASLTDGTDEPALTVYQLGDMVDIWRSLTPDESPADRVNAVMEKYESPIKAMREDLDAGFLFGNHDGQVKKGAPPWLKPAIKEKDVMVCPKSMGRFKQALYLMHGHQFSGVEGLPEALKEAGCRLERRTRGRPPKTTTTPTPGPGNYVVEGTGEAFGEDEYLNARLRPGNLLPMADDEIYPRARAYQEPISPIPGHSPGNTEGFGLERFFFFARQRSWAESSETERVSVMVIGHTHVPRITYGARQDGSLFVLMDCGSWRGSKKLSQRMPVEVLNAQVGVIAENDLRIYQLTY
jgi:UDP-2,3-diacylglucosamine pyrophosphatase LpxH